MLLLLSSHSFLAQDHFGRTGSNYSPTTTLWINPAHIIDSRAFIDFHWAGVDVFAHNNFVYFPGDDLRAARQAERELSPEYSNGRSRYALHANARIQGPSVVFPVKKWAFALTSSARVASSARGIPGPFLNAAVDGLQESEVFGQTFSIERLRVNALAWTELGIGAATIIQDRGGMLTTAGVHLRRVLPISGASVVMDQLRLTVIDSTNLVLDEARGSFGMHDPSNLGSGNLFSGGGWAISTGMSWKRAYDSASGYQPHNPSQQCEWCAYKWKLSLALNDLGWASFDPPFFTGEFDSDNPEEWEDYSNWNPEEASDIDATVRDEFGVQQRGNNNYRVMLPASVAVQYDRHLVDRLYVQFAGVGGIPWENTFGVQHASSIGVVPRWESRNLEVALPLTYAAMQRPTVGLMLRLRSVIIGSDNLLPFTSNAPAYGADFYLHLKTTLYRNPKCKSGSSRTKRSFRRPNKTKRKGHVACPSW